MISARKQSKADRVRGRLCKIAFESLYGPFAWAYDWVSRTFFLRQWRLWQRASIRFIGGPRVLEVGMGTGNLQIDLLKHGYDAYGIDLSPQMLREASRKAHRFGIKPFKVCRGTASSLPFPSECFDTVVSTFPSEYISQADTLGEIARVLKPGGRLVIVPGGWLKSRDAKSKAFEGVARVVYGYKGSKETSKIAEQAREGKDWFVWIAALRERMGEAGFEMKAHVASNERGACLIVVGVRAEKT